MQPEETQRVLRLVRLSLLGNVFMLAVNGAMFYALVVFVVNEPATVEGVSATATPEVDAAADEDPRPSMRAFFSRTGALLDRAARRSGTNPADVMPTKEQIEAAVESRTMHSPESDIVLQKMREGYDYYNLQWPVAIPTR